MPSLTKRALSLFLRNQCSRQFILYLYSDRERLALGMPPRQQHRAGLTGAGALGYEWQEQKVAELVALFGSDNIIGTTGKGGHPGVTPLDSVIGRLAPYQFVVEAAYAADTAAFRTQFGFSAPVDVHGNPLMIGDARPDLLQILPPRSNSDFEAEERPDLALAVLPNGTAEILAGSDSRMRLRVVDIKLSAEPGAAYFAEVTYYAVTLAAWLAERGLADKYVVVAAPAVWPGSYEGSALTKTAAALRASGYEPTLGQLTAALEEDLEVAPFDAYGPRLRQLLTVDLPSYLAQSWDDLEWHVDTRCKGCEFLGAPWNDADGVPTEHILHCMPTAERVGHLSRVAGMPRGGARVLRREAVDTLLALGAVEPSSLVFNNHHGLKVKRTLFPSRARALDAGVAGVIADSGGDALMPQWPDLHVYLFLDYDLASAITVAFGLRAFWREPTPYGVERERGKMAWSESARKGFAEVFVVDERRLDREREELLRFLRALKEIFSQVTKQDEKDTQAGQRDSKTERSTYQIYLWDHGQRKHFTRVLTRHLHYVLADSQVGDLTWLFPAPSQLANAEDASYNSPFTYVSAVVQNTVAVPVPHHYTLLSVVKRYRQAASAPVSVHPLFEEPMSDLIPSERIHELWSRRKHWRDVLNTIAETTRKKLLALLYVVGMLEQDLRPVLSRLAAPKLKRMRDILSGVAPHSQLWYRHARLNGALNELETHVVRAMPPHEREARFKSARLTQRIEGAQRASLLGEILKPRSLQEHSALVADSQLIVYEVAPESRELNARPGDFNFTLSPAAIQGFLNMPPMFVTKGTRVFVPFGDTIGEADLTGVSIEAFERRRGYLVLRSSKYNKVTDLEAAGRLDLSTDVVLDPKSGDFISAKLSATLKAIGFPASAVADQSVFDALGLAKATSTPTPETPASEFLWQASALYSAVVRRDIPGLRDALVKAGVDLNVSQWAAWAGALTRRLSLIWGPPGTGKSQTLRAVILGAVLDAQRSKKSLRLLVTANTYTAVDNVLFEVARDLEALFAGQKPYRVVRLQGTGRVEPTLLQGQQLVENLVVTTTEARPDVLALRSELESPSAQTILVVGAPNQQLYNLGIATKNKRKLKPPPSPVRNWFDAVVIDEASQMDVAGSTLVVTKAAAGASYVLAGDDLQLPPIHAAEPPEGLEALVGSLYSYVRLHHEIEPDPLQVNYRSNRTLVDFIKTAGYSSALTSFAPDLRLQLLAPLPVTKPLDWPAEFYWSPDWAAVLDPESSATCFIYDDDVSSQANPFEVDAVATLIWLLFGRLGNNLLGELSPDGLCVLPSGTVADPKHFWTRSVGVVTPHRAQMGKIVARLQDVFSGHPAHHIRGAVDTVERFQGQQRDVIIASFGVGDPELIQAEDEFLFNLRRFNVLASRARAKLIVLSPRTLVEHLADDPRVLEESRLLKRYVEHFCLPANTITLGYNDGEDRLRHGTLRKR